MTARAIFFKVSFLHPYKLHAAERYDAQRRATEEGNAVVDGPEVTAHDREDHGCQVIDREPDRHTGRDILRIGDLLEIGTDGDGKIEDNKIQNVQYGGDQLRAGKRVPDKNEYQGKVLDRKDTPLTETYDPPADRGRKKIIDRIVHYE